VEDSRRACERGLMPTLSRERFMGRRSASLGEQASSSAFTWMWSFVIGTGLLAVAFVSLSLLAMLSAPLLLILAVPCSEAGSRCWFGRVSAKRHTTSNLSGSRQLSIVSMAGRRPGGGAEGCSFRGYPAVTDGRRWSPRTKPPEHWPSQVARGRQRPVWVLSQGEDADLNPVGTAKVIPQIRWPARFRDRPMSPAPWRVHGAGG
jgi:hypothetical protein